MKSSFVFHLLPNAHLDPVWLWDWREGLNEGIRTVRTVLDLMDERPELTFIRGESAIYEHIQKTDPELFGRLVEMIQCGRWDVVGGTVIQPDTNLAATETLCREFERGLSYFSRHLKVRPKVAWLADSFGHSAGFPNVLSAFGMDGFAFTRPQREQFPLESPAFWWEGDSGNRVLCYRQFWKWYCSEHANMPEILDVTLAGAAKSPLHHVGVLFGVGDHGGGPTRQHLQDIERWHKLHPEVELRFSTLHRFFNELKQEIIAGVTIPVVRGELGFCLRGCYSSVQKFKTLYRRAESHVAATEITRSAIGLATGMTTPGLNEAWHALAFNAFHDILPGSSIERAFDEQGAWVGGAIHQAEDVRFAALNLLASKIDTTVPAPRRADVATDVPFLLWNPLPRPFEGLVELETSLDYRPLYQFEGRPDEVPVVAFDAFGARLPLQVIETEHSSMPMLPWRKRVLVPVTIPSLGWSVVRMGWRDKTEPNVGKIIGRCRAENSDVIESGDWSVHVQDGNVHIAHCGKNLFAANQHLQLRVVEDPWGSWGGMNEETDSICLETTRETWTLAQHEILERGPLRTRLWTLWKGASSWIALTFSLADKVEGVQVEARLLWNERSARLKLILPCEGDLTYDVPGGIVRRDVVGQVPGGRWVTRNDGMRVLGFASDALSDFDATAGELRVTLARATRFANDVPTLPTEKPWQPATDSGELKFRFHLFAHADPDAITDALTTAPAILLPPPKQGEWPRQGSLGQLKPEGVRLLTLEWEGADTVRVRVQNRNPHAVDVRFALNEQEFSLGAVGPQQIHTQLLKVRHAMTLSAKPVAHQVVNGGDSRKTRGSSRVATSHSR